MDIETSSRETSSTEKKSDEAPVQDSGISTAGTPSRIEESTSKSEATPESVQKVRQICGYDNLTCISAFLLLNA